METPKVDNVNSPEHYKAYPVEVKDIIRLTLGLEGYIAWCVGNELKYRLRAGLKNKSTQVEDVEKAMWFRKEADKYRELNKKDDTRFEITEYYMLWQGLHDEFNINLNSSELMDIVRLVI